MNSYCLSILLLVFPFSSAVYDNTWWKTTSIYHTFVWTFKDSDGDGIGDLKGVTSKLDYLSDIGIETIYLSPFYPSPLVDSGYDITNFTAINPVLSTLEDFDELIKEATKRGLKVIIDLVINHSSDEHPWFQKSIKKIDPYTDYYIWKDAKGVDEKGKRIPPTNWVSVFMGSSWQWNEERQQFYFHQFDKKQPDFDLRNKVVEREIMNIMKFWLKKGVAGFRLDAPLFFMEDSQFRDENKTNPYKEIIETFFDLNHAHTLELPESQQFTGTLYKYILKYSKRKGDYERILVTELYGGVSLIRSYYEACTFPLNYRITGGSYRFISAPALENAVQFWTESTPEGKVSNWALENHDNPRAEDIYGEEKSQLLLMMTMMLPGVVTVYYGQEIGITSYNVKPERTQDKGISVGTGKGRDLYRLPMQWDDSLNAGFSVKHVTWLPVNPNYWRINVNNEKNRENSRLNLFKTLSSIRKTETGKKGDLKTYVMSKSMYVFTRSSQGNETYITVLNTGSEMQIADLASYIPRLPPTLTVLAATTNAGYKSGDIVCIIPKFPRFFYMIPHSGLVLVAKSADKTTN